MPMQNLKLWLLILLTPPLMPAAAAGQQAPAKPIVPKGKVTKLFNGHDLDGLYTWLQDTHYDDPRHVFRVDEGMLHVSGDGLGAVITRKSYRDYHLVLEFKWGQKTYGRRKTRARDSGVLIHSVGAEGGYHGIWIPSIEVQIIEGGCGDFILVSGKDEAGQPVPLSLTVEAGRDRDGEVIWQKGNPRETFNLKHRRRINWFGRDPDWKDERGFRGRQDVQSPAGQWTRMDVICDGGHLQVFVNGVMVNEAFDVFPTEGKIQLQSELAEIFFRRWELWPLGQGPKPAKAAQ